MAEVEVIVTQPLRASKIYYTQLESEDTVYDVLLRLARNLSIQFDDVESIVAIHGVVVDKSTRIQEGDRVEVLQPLRVDPKEARRQRAHSGRNKRLKNPHSMTSSSTIFESE